MRLSTAQGLRSQFSSKSSPCRALNSRVAWLAGVAVERVRFATYVLSGALGTTPSELAEKTILYATAKTTYYEALRDAAPELTDIASSKKPRPPEVDQLAQAFSVAGEKQEKVVDEATAVLLGKVPLDANIQRVKAAFDQAQSVEEKFHWGRFHELIGWKFLPLAQVDPAFGL